MAMRKAALAAAARKTIPYLALAIALLLFGGWSVISVLDESSRVGRLSRDAQLARSRTLSYQLDEEAGISGYAGTGKAFFREPFVRARPLMPRALAGLRSAVRALGDDALVSAADDERRLNTVWLATVAQPMSREWADPNAALRLQRRGRPLLDAFRGDNRRIRTRLNEAAAAADARSSRAVRGLVWFVGATLFALICGTAVFVVMRASREDQQRVTDALQLALLNRRLPILTNVALNGKYVPATQNSLIGGDWYDAFELPDKRILFSIGDVAGHGIAAAVAMSRARQAIVTSALQEDDPARILARANNILLWDDAQMVTAICGFIDPHRFEITYATAGHPPPALARPGCPSVFLPYDGLPLGIIENTSYRSFNLKLSQGAVVTLYTDGVIEHGRDIIAGQERLLEATRLAVDADDPTLATHRYIFESTQAVDDVAILSIKFSTRLTRASNDDGATLTNVQERAESHSSVTHAPDDATLAQRFAQLESVNARLLGLLEAAPDAMVVIDGGGCMLFVNAQTERLFGYPRGDLLERGIDILVPTRFALALPAHRNDYTTDPQVGPMGAGLDLHGRRKDGTEFLTEISLSSIHTVDGTLTFCSIRRPSDRRRRDTRRQRDELSAVRSHDVGGLTDDFYISANQVSANREEGSRT